MSEVVVLPMLFLDKARCQRVAGTSLFSIAVCGIAKPGEYTVRPVCTVEEGVAMSVREDRVLSLDGLRGLGALVVFLYHIDIMVHPFGGGGF